MTQEVRHTVRPRDDNTVLLAGEIAYLDSNTIKIGDGIHTFAELPTFSSTNSAADNSTINTNTSNKLQALGTINKNSSDSSAVVFDWIGTTQQYSDQNIATAHPDWLCFIIDDVSGGSTSEMYTKAEIDSFLMSKADGQGSAVMTSGDQSIEGHKTFIGNNCIRAKSIVIDSTTTPADKEYLQNIISFDKGNRRIGCLETCHNTDGSVGIGLNASVNINGSNVYSPVIGTYISQDGQKRFTQTETPTNVAANDGQIATTEHVINVLKAIYPVGAIYIGTQSACPMSTFFGTWELVSSGRALWTGNGSDANTTIAAGLPNITGTLGVVGSDSNAAWVSNVTTDGAFYGIVVKSGYQAFASSTNNTNSDTRKAGFDASRSSSIYGNSSTVQPPAYVVNVWRRTA